MTTHHSPIDQAAEIDLDTDGTYLVDGTHAIEVIAHAGYSYPYGDGAWQDHGARMYIPKQWRAGSWERSRRDPDPRENGLPWTGGDAHRTAHIAGATRIYCIDGVYDRTLAWLILADTARAAAVHDRLLAARREAGRAEVHQAWWDYQQLTPAMREFGGGRDRFHALCERALADGVISLERLEDYFAEFGDSELAKIRSAAHTAPVTPLHLTYRDVAERVGVGIDTIRTWHLDGTLPTPDHTNDAQAQWTWPTIDTWQRTRLDAAIAERV